MSKLIQKIPLADIKEIELYVGYCRKSLAQVVAYARSKAAGRKVYILNLGMWNPDGSACPLLKAGGKWISKQSWKAHGFAWTSGPDICMTAEPGSAKDFWSTTPLVVPSVGAVKKLSYDAKGQGGSRPRSAVGMTAKELVLYCSSTGSPATPEKLRDEMVSMGCTAAVMGDGGGSSQCWYDGKTLKGDGRKCHNYMIVYAQAGSTGQAKTDTASTTPKEGAMSKKYKVTPSVGVNVRSGPSTSYSKTGSYACGTVVEVSETRAGWGKTSKGWVYMTYMEAVTVPQDRVTDTGLVIQQSLIPSGRKNRPGGSNPDRFITIHETGNYAKGANASAHASYLSSDAAVKAEMSWHYTVDDHAIVQHIPDGEKAWHAGDGANGPGNSTSIGIEICVDADGDFERAQENAAALVRLLMKEHGIGIGNVVQHNHWNGKDCPHTIRHTAGGWDAFLRLVKKSTGEEKPVEKWYEKARKWAMDKGITDGTRPEDKVTRAEVWSMLMRLTKE